MKSLWKKQQTVVSYGVVLLTCVLVASFGLHTIQVEHAHPGHTDTAHHDGSVVENLGEYLHGNSKQDFFILLIAFLTLGTFLLVYVGAVLPRLVFKTEQHVFSVIRQYRLHIHGFDLYQLLLSRGILHPKVH